MHIKKTALRNYKLEFISQLCTSFFHFILQNLHLLPFHIVKLHFHLGLKL